MTRYISILFLTVFVGVILFIILGSVFIGGDPAENAIYTIGTIIVILLSFLISEMYYLINLIKNKL